MGTRSLTTFIDNFDNKEIVVMYRQMDGYPKGHGIDLLEFLQGMDVVNGLPVGRSDASLANGMSCLAAQVISHFKQGAGEFYLHTANTRDYGEEYIYTIYVNKINELSVKVSDVYCERNIFDGNIKAMRKWLKQRKEIRINEEV